MSRISTFGEDTAKRLCEKYGPALLGSVPMDASNCGREIIALDQSSAIALNLAAIASKAI